jgi:2-amino-4-hydroxy-6-hydroxymethyldihydropteridine diphosphokinase
MTSVQLLIGSNLGDRARQLSTARELIGERVGAILRTSPVFETQPWGLQDQPYFLNQALEVMTPLQPTAVLDAILGIEMTIGRVSRTHRFGARIIDIDILLYGDSVISDDRLVIPHPRMHLRRFTLVPLSCIASEVVHPILKQTVGELLRQCTDNLLVTEVGGHAV